MLARAVRLYAVCTTTHVRQHAVSSGSAAKTMFARQFHQTSVSQLMPNFDLNNPTVREIQKSPRAMEAIADAVQLLQSKGFVDSTSNAAPPSFMKMMKIMADSDVMEKFKRVQEVMQEEGIKFSASDIGSFMGAAKFMNDFGKDNRDDISMKQETNEVSEKKGLLGRISDSFKSKP
ncbi:hypothetical protein IWW43_004184 [Coemansia sp. RSA 1935]|nr:hypothetical protein J3F82_000355 [Coemansia sp. RSA 637]KAJ2530706.1 hypothetical protein IWW43_004184 [Coemansia sp. RSA 1935]